MVQSWSNMSVRSHRHQFDGSEEGGDLQATPFSNRRLTDNVHQPTSAQEEGHNNVDQTEANKPTTRRQTCSSEPHAHTALLGEIYKTLDIDPPKPLRSQVSEDNQRPEPYVSSNSDHPKSLRTDGDTIGLLISDPSEESLAAAAALHNQEQKPQVAASGGLERAEREVRPSTETTERPHPRDFIKPLLDDQDRALPRSPMLQQTPGNQQQQQVYQQQQPLHQQQQRTPRLNLQEYGGGQRSLPQGPPPAYEDTIRQSPGRRIQQGSPSPNHSPGSSEDVADFLGAMKLSTPAAGNQPSVFNVTINHINQPQFHGAGNPMNFGGIQDSAYKRSTLTATGPHPGGARPKIGRGTGNPINLGGGGQRVCSYPSASSPKVGVSQIRGGGYSKRGVSDDRKQAKSEELSPYASSEVTWKPGSDVNTVEADPDVIIEEEYECFEGGAGDDNQDGPPSDSMISVTSNQSEVVPYMLPANQKISHTFGQSGAIINKSPTTNQSKPASSVQSESANAIPLAKVESYTSNQSDATTLENLKVKTNQRVPSFHTQSEPLSAPGMSTFPTNQMRELQAHEQTTTANQMRNPQAPDQTATNQMRAQIPEQSTTNQMRGLQIRNQPAANPSRDQQTTDQSAANLTLSANQQNSQPFFQPKSAKAPNEGSIVQAKILQPHEYQEELAHATNKGYNNIIIAPAGTGKSSAITTLICKEHLGRREPEARRPKIAIIVPTVVLVEQVYNTLREYLPNFKINKRSGVDITKQSLKSLTHGSDILVMTPKILVNGLTVLKSVTLRDFSLLLVDECHRAMKDSPEVQIMEVYRNDREQNLPTPQVVGMTASPSICGNTDDEKAQDCIMEMCANLDTQLINTVQEHTTELQEHTNTPDKEVKVVERREKDPFRERVEAMMISIEGAITGGRPLPIGRGHQRYRSYVEGIYKKALEAKRSDIEKCCRHLFEYNKVLQVLDLVRMKDAMEQLEEFHKKLHKPQDDMDHKLRNLYQENFSDLWQLCQQEADFPNPKMAILKQGILEEYERCVEHEKDFKCMVFVEQRLLTTAIQNWMQNDRELCTLKPGVLTGAHANVDEGGMTKSTQEIAITQFRSGDQKILISTSIGIEGLNIPACNMVISYSYSMDEVKMVQYRGRARAQASVEMSVGTGESADKYVDNIAVIAVMERAIEFIQSMSNEEFHKNVQEKQQKLVEKKDEKEERKLQRQQEHSPDDVQFLCKGCDVFVCYASDIRRAGTQASNYINPDETFKYFKVDTRPHHDEKKRKMGIKKIYCKKCEQDWGNTFKGHPCLKIESFKCETKDGLRTFKKWKQVNFDIEMYKK